MILKLCMKHQGEDLYKVSVNYGHGMTLTYFTVAHAFKWGKLSKCHLKEKLEGNGQID